MQYSNLYRRRQISNLKILNDSISEHEHKLCLLLDDFFLNVKIFNDSRVDIDCYIFYVHSMLDENFTYKNNVVYVNAKLFWKEFYEYKDLSILDITYLVTNWVESIRLNFKVSSVYIDTHQENLRSNKMSEITAISDYWDFLFSNIENKKYENNHTTITLQSLIDDNKDDNTDYEISDINTTIKLIYDFALEHCNKNVVSHCDIFKTLKYLIVGDIDIYDQELKEFENFLILCSDQLISGIEEAVKTNSLNQFITNDPNWNFLTISRIYYIYDISEKFPRLNKLIKENSIG